MPSNDQSIATKDSGRYGLLFELSEDAVVEIEMVDRLPIVRAVNPAFVEVFGYDREAILGESLNEFIVPERHRGEAATFDRRTAEGAVNWASVWRATATGVREFLYRGVPFERNGSSHGLAIYTDVTDRRRRDRHHEVLHRVLRHNLRNDLTRILAATERLRSEVDDDRIEAYADRVTGIAEDLKRVSREAGRVEDVFGEETPATEPVEFSRILDGLVTQYRQEWPSVRFESDLSRSCRVRADHRLDTAVDALVENAVEHGVKESTGTVVRLTLDGTDSEAVATVTDDGPGIPELERATVFERQPISQLSHGSGLGLWLAKWIVESYGGRLTYERRDGETSVGMRLPLAAD